VSDQPFEVTWSPTAQRDLKRLPEKVVTAVAEFAYGALAANPHRVGRPLHLELTGRHAARRGSYRVVYRIDDEERLVRVESVDHRSDVYRRR
jgi:mRNA-degrading endonuclease RelE of RelBE toxin-antitoxin system